MRSLQPLIANIYNIAKFCYNSLVVCFSSNFLFNLVLNFASDVPYNSSGNCKRQWIKYINTITASSERAPFILNCPSVSDREKGWNPAFWRGKSTKHCECMLAKRLQQCSCGYHVRNLAKLAIQVLYMS